MKKFGICAAYNNGATLVDIAVNKRYQIEFIATYSKDNPEEVERIRELAESNNINYLHKVDANSEEFIGFLRDTGVELVFLCWWPQIIRKQALYSVREGWVNLHPSLLPFGRGKHAYFWSIVEGYQFGVSIHFIDEGIDTGPVLFQKIIPVDFGDTGEVLYNKGVAGSIQIFDEKFVDIVKGRYTAIPQNLKEGTSRFSGEIDEITNINPSTSYKALDLITLLRARSFENGPSCLIKLDGKKYWMHLKVEEVK